MSEEQSATEDEVVSPARRVRGTVDLPGDKSISHRGLLFGALGRGETVLTGLSDGDDVRQMRRCLQALGVRIEDRGDDVIVHGVGLRGLRSPDHVLDCGNSGTAMRLLAGLVVGAQIDASLDGDESLRRRPMERVLEPLRRMGARASSSGDRGTAPLHIAESSALTGIVHDLSVASAQVATALTIAALGAQGRSEIHLPLGARDHTPRMLAAMGAPIVCTRDDALEHHTIEGPAPDLAPLGRIRVPGDPSAGAFFAAAAALAEDGDVTLPSISVNPTRFGFYDALRAMGARVDIHDLRTEGGEPIADVRVRHGRQLVASSPERAAIPTMIDELPLLAMVATRATGTSSIRFAEELRVKESDRIAATTAALGALGVAIDERADGWVIQGPQPVHAGSIDSRGDHRIAMASAILALSARGPVEIRDASWVQTSHPGFFGELRSLTQR